MIQLPAIINKSQNRQQLLALLNEKYPDVLVEDMGEDVCWGTLRLKFAPDMELIDITEGCR